MARPKTIVITGGDGGFFQFISETILSLQGLQTQRGFDLGVLDQGLSSEQLDWLGARGVQSVKPEWDDDIPQNLRDPRAIGLVARSELRDYFPGYSSYLWFDADAWAQTPEFFDTYICAAETVGAAVATEGHPAYRPTLAERRWWAANLIYLYGAAGLGLAIQPSINIGLLALSDTAPHWKAWKDRYRQTIAKRGKLNMDQHAFHAAVHLDDLPTLKLHPRHNWICTLATPVWNPVSKKFCDPVAPHAPISVLHLAGPNKRRLYDIKGLAAQSELTYPAYLSLSGEAT
jgi:hypothetical protein